MDIVILKNITKAVVKGITARGQAWVNRKMYKPQMAQVTIDAEHIEEIENLIKADGLTVSKK